MEQNLSKKENFNAVDLAKFIMAFCVISIHTCYNFFESAAANTIVGSVIIRLAVPFFFVASGFFFFRGIVFEKGRIKKCPENRAKFFGFLKRTFLLYTLWAIVYFAVEALTYIDAKLPIASLAKTYFFAFFLDGVASQFWYLLFLIYGVIVLYALLRLLRIEIVGVIVGILFIVFFASYTYRYYFDVDFLDRLASIFLYVKIAPISLTVSIYHLYTAMGFLLAGFLCIYLRGKISTGASGILAGVSLCLTITENILATEFLGAPWHRQSNSYTIFLVPTAVFGFIFLSKIKLSGKPRLFSFFRNGSSFIYCAHLLIMIIFNHLTERRFVDKPILFFIISGLSLAVTLIFIPLSGKIKFLKKLY